MGPRRDRRGEDKASADADIEDLLQWGRVVIDAERIVGLPILLASAALQWGRVVIDAER